MSAVTARRAEDWRSSVAQLVIYANSLEEELDAASTTRDDLRAAMALAAVSGQLKSVAAAFAATLREEPT